MNILIYTQVGHIGGSMRLLLNLAKYLSEEFKVTLLAPDLEPDDQSEWGNIKNLKLCKTKEFNIPDALFDIALYHLPFGVDEYYSINAHRRIMVTMEIMGLHPINLNHDALAGFEKIICLHKEQSQSILSISPKSNSMELPIINNIDFTLPFSKTNNVASVGAAFYKHSSAEIVRLIRKTKGINNYFAYTNELPKFIDVLEQNSTFNYYNKTKKIQIKDVEWNSKKLYSGFDILFHVPTEGNGTSMVVSDMLSLGKPVVLSPLKAYREAYGSLEGVFFNDSLQSNLSKLLSNYDTTLVEKIKESYRRVYDRDNILKQWKDALTK